MRTIKRTPGAIDVDLRNTNKYFNHMNFKGIMKEDNTFVTDQESFTDALNVYVDTEKRLVSRPTLQVGDVPDIIITYLAFSSHKLIEINDKAGIGKIYVLQNVSTNKYFIEFIPNSLPYNSSYSLPDIPDYNLAIINHYIICFNSIKAKIIDTNTTEKIQEGWQNFLDAVYIPITKSVVGNEITEYPGNQFTKSYKERYIISNLSNPQLPEGTTADVELKTANRRYNYNLTQADKLTNYRLTKEVIVSLQENDLITTDKVGKNHICIAREQYFLLSLNGGESFIQLFYPVYSGEFLNIASISEDGNFFYFVTNVAVYRCNLGSYDWSEPIYLLNNSTNRIGVIDNYQGKGYKNICCFKDGTTFSFLTYITDDVPSSSSANNRGILYMYGPGLYPSTNPDNDYILFGSVLSGNPKQELTEDYKFFNGQTQISMCYGQLNNKTITLISFIYPLYVDDNDNNIHEWAWAIKTIIGGNTKSYTGLDNMCIIELVNTDLGWLQLVSNYNLEASTFYKSWPKDIEGKIYDGIYMNISYTRIDNSQSSTQGYLANSGNILIGLKADNMAGSSYSKTLEVNTSMEQSIFVTSKDNPAPLMLEAGYIGFTNTKLEVTPVLLDKGTIRAAYPIPQLENIPINNILNIQVSGNFYYIIVNQNNNLIMYTNRLLDTDSASLVYSYNISIVFNEVPSVSYSDSQLFLAFDNNLKITQNIQDTEDPTKIWFNLPIVNNQSFIDSITNMVNISTVEVAIFFNNKIIICKKIEDSNLGNVYAYYNTKLSTGVRSIIDNKVTVNDSVINTLEGSLTVFPTLRGLAVMNYQAFMATTDQTLTYLTDSIREIWSDFYNQSSIIKILQHRDKLVITNKTNVLLLYDLTNNSWWKWEVPCNPLFMNTNQVNLSIIDGDVFEFKDVIASDNAIPQYYDFSEIPRSLTYFRRIKPKTSMINWYIISQPLHMKVPNYYKNLKQLIFQLYDNNSNDIQKTINVQIKLYRKRVSLKEPEVVNFKIDELRTFVKRFNYWKINEVQWGISNDTNTNVPFKMQLNGISIKYEIGEEVR